VPPFDPLVGFAYMGDYISLVSDGVRQYIAWGDNRERIVNFTHPQGRNDPNVYRAALMHVRSTPARRTPSPVQADSAE
jgi:hypothetical protein